MNKREITEFRKSLDIPDYVTDEEIKKTAEGTLILAGIRIHLAKQDLANALAIYAKPILEKANTFAKKLHLSNG